MKRPNKKEKDHTRILKSINYTVQKGNDVPTIVELEFHAWSVIPSLVEFNSQSQSGHGFVK